MVSINSPIDEIKSRLDIVEVIGSYVKLQKAGLNYRALCPFHSEKKPSFFVSPSRQIWHCFGGCGEGGDIFKFIMRIEGVEFGDALRILAQRAGVELKRENPELRTKREHLYEICELASLFFEKQLWESKRGGVVIKYLYNRGIKEDSIKKWRIGYSPETWNALSNFLLAKKYKEEEIEKAGLALRSEQGSLYDRFRGRIIFPIFDINSQVIGFGGRVSPEEEKDEVAKYVNTPNTLVYDKSKTLYGLNFSKTAIRRQNASILVEGYTDVISLYQAGFENVVSTSGTALTLEQLKILKRYSDNLLTAFDMDLAGDSATKRGIELAQTMGFNIKVIIMPAGLDPADTVLKDKELFNRLLNEAKSIYDFYFDTTLTKFDRKSPDGKKEIAKILIPLIKRIPNHIERYFWIQRLATELEVREEAVLEELKRTNLTSRYYGEEEKEEKDPPPRSRKELLQERLLTLVLRFPHLSDYIPAEGKKKLDHIREATFVNQNYLNYLYFVAENEEIKEKDALPEIKFCLKEIEFLEIKEKLDNISRDIKRAEEEKDGHRIEELVRNFNQLAKKIQLS